MNTLQFRTLNRLVMQVRVRITISTGINTIYAFVLSNNIIFFFFSYDP